MMVTQSDDFLPLNTARHVLMQQQLGRKRSRLAGAVQNRFTEDTAAAVYHEMWGSLVLGQADRDNRKVAAFVHAQRQVVDGDPELAQLLARKTRTAIDAVDASYTRTFGM